MSDLTGHFRTYSRRPHFSETSHRTMSGIWIWAQQLVFWENSINTTPSPTAQSAWPLHFPVEQAHILYSKRPISLSPKSFILSSCLWIEWSKDLSSLCDSPPQVRLACWIFILQACYSWSVAPRRLEVALMLPLSVVSHVKVCEGPLRLHKRRSKS
jgi:hypothetical protein